MNDCFLFLWLTSLNSHRQWLIYLKYQLGCFEVIFPLQITCLINELKKLRRSSPEDKCIVVSQWTSMLEVVGKHLEQMGIRHLYITGKTSVKDRAAIVDDFNLNARSPQVREKICSKQQLNISFLSLYIICHCYVSTALLCLIGLHDSC